MFIYSLCETISQLASRYNRSNRLFGPHVNSIMTIKRNSSELSRSIDYQRGGFKGFKKRSKQRKGPRHLRNITDATYPPLQAFETTLVGSKRRELLSGDSLRQFMINFDRFCSDTWRMIRMTDEQMLRRQDLIARFNRFVTRSDPQATLVPFGSAICGLGTPKSDVDLVLLPNLPRKKLSECIELSRWEQLACARVLARELKQKPKAFRNVVCISARVPILKLVDCASRCHVDISFGSVSGVENTLAMRAVFKDEPRLRAVILLVRHFLQGADLSDNSQGGLGGYATVWTVVWVHRHFNLCFSSDLFTSNERSEFAFLESIDSSNFISITFLRWLLIFSSPRVVNGRFFALASGPALNENLPPRSSLTYNSFYSTPHHDRICFRDPCNSLNNITHNCSRTNELLLLCHRTLSQFLTLKDVEALPNEKQLLHSYNFDNWLDFCCQRMSILQAPKKYAESKKLPKLSTLNHTNSINWENFYERLEVL